MILGSIDKSFRLPRIWSNSVLKQIGVCFSGEVVNVSGWDDRDKQGGRYRDYFPRATRYYISNYRGQRGLDDAANLTDFSIDLSGPVEDELHKRFDVVFNHTTLEHVFEMRQAFRNLCDMTRDILIVVVPAVQESHPTSSYGDYWRFMPMGLRCLFDENGMEVIYEAANHDRACGNYLLFVGSYKGNQWNGKLPPWEAVDEIGAWVGFGCRAALGRIYRRIIRRP